MKTIIKKHFEISVETDTDVWAIGVAICKPNSCEGFKYGIAVAFLCFMMDFMFVKTS